MFYFIFLKKSPSPRDGEAYYLTGLLGFFFFFTCFLWLKNMIDGRLRLLASCVMIRWSEKGNGVDPGWWIQRLMPFWNSKFSSKRQSIHTLLINQLTICRHAPWEEKFKWTFDRSVIYHKPITQLARKIGSRNWVSCENLKERTQI